MVYLITKTSKRMFASKFDRRHTVDVYQELIDANRSLLGFASKRSPDESRSEHRLVLYLLRATNFTQHVIGIQSGTIKENANKRRSASC
jgi:hypothetical protein